MNGFGTPGLEAVRFEHLSYVNSPNLGITVNTAQLALSDVTISGHANQAMLACQAGSIYGDHVRIIDNNSDDVQVTGSVSCSVHGVIDSRRGRGSFGLQQLSTASGGNNLIANGCFMMAGPGTTVLAGQTFVSVGAYVGTEGGPAAVVRFNALSCLTGGKFTTNGGGIYVNNVPGIPAACVASPI